jgi:hypothetical protein
MSASIREHLQATISHLDAKRDFHLIEADRLFSVLKTLRVELDALPRTESIPFPPSQGEFAGISMRWAILSFFSQNRNGPQTLGLIVDALRAGGATTKGQSFNSNVSAVLSVMVSKGELDKSEEGFALTDHGRTIWQGISNSEKFLNRNQADSSDNE